MCPARAGAQITQSRVKCTNHEDTVHLHVYIFLHFYNNVGLIPEFWLDKMYYDK